MEYRNTGAVDPSGQSVYEGSLLRYKHPTDGYKYSHHLYPVYRMVDGSYITYDDFIVTTETLHKERLYVVGHITTYKGNIEIYDRFHVLDQQRNHQIWNNNK